jgi:transposase
MPWLETAPMEQRERFIRDHQLALYTMVELSARYGISRKTGYKWLDRFDEGGREGLGDRSRAPQIDEGGLRPLHFEAATINSTTAALANTTGSFVSISWTNDAIMRWPDTLTLRLRSLFRRLSINAAATPPTPIT